MQKLNLTTTLFAISGILLLAGAVLSILKLEYGAYVFSAGSVGLVCLQAKEAYDKRNEELRNKRLARISLFNNVLLVLAAYSMFTSTNSWVVLLLVYALSSFFLSFRGDTKN